jgi:hypothetical protein
MKFRLLHHRGSKSPSSSSIASESLSTSRNASLCVGITFDLPYLLPEFYRECPFPTFNEKKQKNIQIFPVTGSNGTVKPFFEVADPVAYPVATFIKMENTTPLQQQGGARRTPRVRYPSRILLNLSNHVLYITVYKGSQVFNHFPLFLQPLPNPMEYLLLFLRSEVCTPLHQQCHDIQKTVLCRIRETEIISQVHVDAVINRSPDFDTIESVYINCLCCRKFWNQSS